MGILAYSNKAIGATITDLGSAFSTNPPISNMGTRQVPSPYAEFTGTSASFTVVSSTAEDVRVLALLSHTLPESAVITWKTTGGTTITSDTWNAYKNRPANSYAVLSAAQSLSGIRCDITGANSGTNRIGGVWFSKGWEFEQTAGFRWQPQSSARITRIDGTDWTTDGVRRRGIPITAIGTRGEIIGVGKDGTIYSGDDAETVLSTAGLYGPVIAIPSIANQNTIDATAIYGALDSPGSPEHIEGDVFRVSFRVLESR